MPILPEFRKFQEAQKSEANFVSQFLIPLIERLGYYEVRNYHGSREHGKDIVFAEIDRFAQITYHGLQAKYEDSISINAMEGLITDCKQAFRHTFQHPTTGKIERITTFYVVNAGSIGHEARNNFYEGVGDFRGCTRIFDGPELLAIDRLASVSSNRREILTGLLMELRFNEGILLRVKPELELIANSDGNNAVYPVFRLRFNAFGSYLSIPFLPAKIPLDCVERYWTVSAYFNRTLDSVGSSPLHTVVSIKIPAQHALQAIDQLTKDAAILREAIEQIINSLSPLATK